MTTKNKNFNKERAMKKIIYRVKLENNMFLKSSCLQSTKDKFLSVMNYNHAKSRERFGTLIEDTITLKPCLLCDMEFGIGDTYAPVSVDGFIIHETSKYVYACKVDRDGEPIYSTTRKHKKEHEGTYDFKTCTGFKYIENN